MDPTLAREARRLLDRYIVEVVERFDLCPWAAPARARGEVRIEISDPGQVSASLATFLPETGHAIILVAMPGFTGTPVALRRFRDELLEVHGATLALADFHPDAELDRDDAARVVPFLRRAPDPLLQAVRHETLASLRRAHPALSIGDQAALLAGRAIARRRDPVDEVAAANFATVARDEAGITAALDDIARDRAQTYARLAAISTRR